MPYNSHNLMGTVVKTAEAVELTEQLLSSHKKIILLGGLASGKTFLMEQVNQALERQRDKLKDQYQNEFPMPVFVDPYSAFEAHPKNLLESRFGGIITSQEHEVDDALLDICHKLNITIAQLMDTFDNIIVANCGEYFFLNKRNMSEHIQVFVNGETDGKRGYRQRIQENLRIQSAVAQFATDFTISDILRRCPDVSKDVIKVVLARMKRKGEVEAVGRGAAARWRKTQ